MRTGTTSRSAIAPTMPHMGGELLLGTDDCKRRAATGLAGAHPGATGVTGKAQSRPGALLQKRELPGKASARTLRVSGRTVSAAGNRRWINDLRLARMLRLDRQ